MPPRTHQSTSTYFTCSHTELAAAAAAAPGRQHPTACLQPTLRLPPKAAAAAAGHRALVADTSRWANLGRQARRTLESQPAPVPYESHAMHINWNAKGMHRQLADQSKDAQIASPKARYQSPYCRSTPTAVSKLPLQSSLQHPWSSAVQKAAAGQAASPEATGDTWFERWSKVGQNSPGGRHCHHSSKCSVR
jgi:hypothetical protein